METYIILLAIVACSVNCSEPICSKFDYQEQLLEKMIRTEIKVETMEESIRTTQTEIVDNLKSFQTDIRNVLNETQTEIKDQLESLSGGWKMFQAEIETFKKQILKKTNSEISTMKTSIKQMEDQIGRISENLEKLENDTVTNRLLIEVAKTPNVAFRASLSSDIVVSPGTDLLFPDVRINHGDGYDVTTGHFTAPVTGTYYVTVQVCPFYQKYMEVNLVVDGSVQTVARYYEHHTYMCFTTNDVINLEKDNAVWVKCGVETSSSTTLFQNSYLQTYFAAVLVNL